MKIKLVTFAPHPNFGTCLQSYALNKVLRDMGHDVEFIYNGHENPTPTLVQRMKSLIKVILPLSIVHRIQKKLDETDRTVVYGAPVVLELPNSKFRLVLSKLPFYETIYKMLKCRTLQWKKVYKFTFEDGNYNMRRLYTSEDYVNVVADADIFMTGSDQIWNPYCGGFNPMMFLEFAGDKKRIAYSSSIARPEFPVEIRDRAKNDLAKFTHIAVRESQSVDMLNALLVRDDVKLVVDPTLLLTSEQWSEFASHATIEFELPKEYILCYFLGDKKIYDDMVNDVKIKTGIKDVITVDCTGGYINYGNGFIYRDAGPYEFVYLIQHASMVCMNSFHATVFSLIFKVNFVHILKTQNEKSIESQNSRMYDLFSRYGMLSKLYKKDSVEWKNDVDYDRVNSMLQSDILNSYNILKDEICN